MVAKGRSDLVRTKPVAEKKLRPAKKAQQEHGCSDKTSDSPSDKSNVDVQTYNSELHISTTPERIVNKAPSIEIIESNRQSTGETIEYNQTKSPPINERGKQSETIISRIKRLFKFQLHNSKSFDHFVNSVLSELIHLNTQYYFQACCFSLTLCEK